MSENKTTAERIDETKKNIAAMEAAIGRAYLNGDEDGIPYYKMHLSAYKSTLEELEKQLEEERVFTPTEAITERCMTILRALYAQYTAASERTHDRFMKYGDDGAPTQLARKNEMKAYTKYANQCAFAAAFLGVDVYDLMHDVQYA